jgi:non-canonical purine NTP pyrophosphatase (RdgB/HAM1 family)
MQTVYFATTNKDKIQIAQTVCADAGITVEPVMIEVDEIQGEDPELIVVDKAKRAFEVLGKPVIVSDDTWNIRALNGFPGPYMKSINYWFTPQDFLRLMDGVKDRKATIHQYLAYTDGKTTKVFKNEIPGKIINEIRGENSKSPNTTVTVLDSDNGKTIAEVFERGEAAVIERYKNRPDAWHEFIKWHKSNR